LPFLSAFICSAALCDWASDQRSKQASQRTGSREASETARLEPASLGLSAQRASKTMDQRGAAAPSQQTSKPTREEVCRPIREMQGEPAGQPRMMFQPETLPLTSHHINTNVNFPPLALPSQPDTLSEPSTATPGANRPASIPVVRRCGRACQSMQDGVSNPPSQLFSCLLACLFCLLACLPACLLACLPACRPARLCACLPVCPELPCQAAGHSAGSLATWLVGLWLASQLVGSRHVVSTWVRLSVSYMISRQRVGRPAANSCATKQTII
jgi:hypothetical protein